MGICEIGLHVQQQGKLEKWRHQTHTAIFLNNNLGLALISVNITNSPPILSTKSLLIGKKNNI